MFEEERRRQGKPDLGIQISFLYGCGGAGPITEPKDLIKTLREAIWGLALIVIVIMVIVKPF